MDILTIYICIVIIIIFDGVSSSEMINLALGKKSYQSDILYGSGPERVVDGNTSNNWHLGSCSHTASLAGAYWEVDLAQIYLIEKVTIFNRMDCCVKRLRQVELYFGFDNTMYSLRGTYDDWVDNFVTIKLDTRRYTRWVKVTRHPSVNETLILCEVEVYGFEDRKAASITYTDAISDTEQVIAEYSTPQSLQQCAYLCLKVQNCTTIHFEDGICNILNY